MNKPIAIIMLLIILYVSFFIVAANIQLAKSEFTGEITINADGSVTPANSPVTITGNIYTLTGNIDGSVFLARSNIDFNGAGHSVRGIMGIPSDSNPKNNVTIENVVVTLSRISDSTGINLYGFYNSKALGNIITNNYFGLQFGASTNNTFRNNQFSQNSILTLNLNFLSTSSSQDFDNSNLVDGKPIYFWMNKQDLTVPLDAGLTVLVSSTNITVQNLNLTSSGQGILLLKTMNSTV